MSDEGSRFTDKDIEKIFVPASRVQVGDTLYFGDPQYDIQIEKASVNGFDGVIVLQAKGGGWTSWYEPGAMVCIHATHERTRIEGAAKLKDEAGRIMADLRYNEMKQDGTLERMALERALAEQVKWGQA